MEPKFYDIICPKCRKAGFESNENRKSECKACGYILTEDDVKRALDSAHQELMQGSMHIEALRVYEFETGGESDWIIASTRTEAIEYYASVVSDDIDNYKVTEFIDWHDENVCVEVDEQQSNGTYYKDHTMLEIAKGFYPDGYDGPELIASTVEEEAHSEKMGD